MPVVSNLENLYTFFPLRHFVNIWKEEEKNEVYRMKYPMIFDDFFYTIYLFARSSPPQLTIELFSPRSVHVGGGDVLLVVVLRLNFVVLSLSRTVSMKLCFRCLSARL